MTWVTQPSVPHGLSCGCPTCVAAKPGPSQAGSGDRAEKQAEGTFKWHPTRASGCQLLLFERSSHVVPTFLGLYFLRGSGRKFMSSMSQKCFEDESPEHSPQPSIAFPELSLGCQRLCNIFINSDRWLLPFYRGCHSYSRLGRGLVPTLTFFSPLSSTSDPTLTIPVRSQGQPSP